MAMDALHVVIEGETVLEPRDVHLATTSDPSAPLTGVLLPVALGTAALLPTHRALVLAPLTAAALLSLARFIRARARARAVGDGRWVACRASLDDLRVTQGRERVTLPWSAITRWYETPECFVIEASELHRVLPKRSFPGGGAARIGELLLHAAPAARQGTWAALLLAASWLVALAIFFWR